MRRAGVVLMLVALTACSNGPGFEVAVRHAPVDITYGDQSSDVAPPRAPGASLDPSTFPGFIAPPVPLRPPTTDLLPDPTRDPCPRASAFAVPKYAAGTTVGRAPREGIYPMRREGFTKTAPLDSPGGYDDVRKAPAQPLTASVQRRVSETRAIEQADGTTQYAYDVIQVERSLRTTTSYLVDNDSGLFITRIVTVRDDLPGAPGGESGTESFNPQPAIKIMNLPVVREPNEAGYLAPTQYGTGVDPLTGIQMEVFFRTVDKMRVDACGEPIEAWRVRFNGHFTRNDVREYKFNGEFGFAPQLGGLIVHDAVALTEGRDDAAAVLFEQESTSIVNATKPVKR